MTLKLCPIQWSLFIGLLFAPLQHVSSLIVPKRSVDFTLPIDYPQQMPFYQLTTLTTEHSYGSNSANLSLGAISVVALTPAEIGDALDDLFAINSSSGELYLLRPLAALHAKIGLSKRQIIIPIYSEAVALVTLTISFLRKSKELCQGPGAALCFPGQLTYLIPETLPPGTSIDNLVQPLIQHACSDTLQLSYNITLGSEVAQVNPKTGDLVVLSELDAESETRLKLKVTCTISQLGKVPEEHTVDAKLEVVDEDDNAPYLQPGMSTVIDVDLAAIKVDLQLPVHLNVVDRDSQDANTFEVFIEKDVLGFFEEPEVVMFKDVESVGNALMVNAFIFPKKPVAFKGSTYEFDVIFKDVGLVKPGLSNTVTYHVIIHNRRPEPFPGNASEDQVPISRLASQYARVAQPFAVPQHSSFEFELHVPGSQSKSPLAFNITRKTGIIYVGNFSQLRKMNESLEVLNVTWKSFQAQGFHLLSINITNDEQTIDQCGLLCSTYNNEEACTSGCGRGAPTGHCQWRNFSGSGNLTWEYATCSPNLLTCPDKVCDELEKAHRTICPQDCAEEVYGEAVSTEHRGISLARGTCTCHVVGRCSCLDSSQLPELPVKSPRGEPRPAVERSLLHNISEANTERHSPVSDVQMTDFRKMGKCNTSCVLMIILAIGATVILTVFAVVYHHCRMRKAKQKHKHVGSRISLSVVPSDYVDERRPSSVQSEQTTEYTTTKWLYDSKWEFPREQLILEQTIGEGEFGKVVKAQAWGLNGAQSCGPVAVKMLKGNGSVAELQDLLSEFNLLKDVKHPNIIKLLGACTQKDGPLLVIVEFAEHGSLRQYLRQCRHLEFDNVSQIRTMDNPSYMMSENALTQRDLLSFAWQIARGMAYLSDMKLVHRDLAARNVLLATDKVIKISDFGLSRDVYEGDTYFKRSKGRVPVKWMALESLKDHVYTTKSDVWSFGVVLWEIVTLAASPYPGITPERLYQLLRAGYRMEKPDNCSVPLYNIMLHCWRENPFERPQFKELAQKFDDMLQDTTVYLDLNAVLSESKPLEEHGEPSRCCLTSDSDSDGPLTPLTNAYPGTSQLIYGKLNFPPSETSSIAYGDC